MAAARRYAVATQLKATAFNNRSLSMEGSAILTEDPVKGVRKELIPAMSNTRRLETSFVAVSVIFYFIPFLQHFGSLKYHSPGDWSSGQVGG